jgi:hypothetical protein
MTCLQSITKSKKPGISIVRSSESISHLNQDVLIDRELKFDLKVLFGPAVAKWLEVTDAKTIEWVERAVHSDALKPDNDEMKQSSSAMDLFRIIGEAVEFLKKLQWPDEGENAKFATFLARVSRTVSDLLIKRL